MDAANAAIQTNMRVVLCMLPICSDPNQYESGFVDAANAAIQTNMRGGIALGQTRKQAKTTDQGSLVATRSNQVKNFKNSTDLLNIESMNPGDLQRFYFSNLFSK